MDPSWYSLKGLENFYTGLVRTTHVSKFFSWSIIDLISSVHSHNASLDNNSRWNHLQSFRLLIQSYSLDCYLLELCL